MCEALGFGTLLKNTAGSFKIPVARHLETRSVSEGLCRRDVNPKTSLAYASGYPAFLNYLYNLSEPTERQWQV